ncbi:MAG: hypothetical protein L6437_14740, partial [Kiritimatiellae bacterium]|nr:hypothetical protein [Kiritimatiellia bacterium]
MNTRLPLKRDGRGFVVLTLSVMLALSLLAMGSDSDISWLDDNIVPNAGFELISSNASAVVQGWKITMSSPGAGKVSLDTNYFITGSHALRIQSDDTNSHITVSSEPIPVEAGVHYLFSLAFRQEGFNSTGDRSRYEGVSSYPRLEWFDSKGKSAGRSLFISSFPYGPSLWDLRDALEPVPSNAATVKIQFILSNRAF